MEQAQTTLPDLKSAHSEGGGCLHKKKGVQVHTNLLGIFSKWQMSGNACR